MKKRFKTKKRIHKRKIYIIIMLFLICLFFNNISISLNKSYEKIIKFIFNNSITQENKINFKISDLSEKIFNNPILFLKSNIKINNQTNLQSIVLAYSEKKYPLIYIYNSHQGETYSYEYLENYNIVPDVLMASKMLKEKLDEKGITTIVEENNILEYMKKNNYNHAQSYIASRYFLSKIINEYSDNIKLYIDLHRDAAEHEVTYTKINGKDCAKVLFVIGLENPNYKYNLEIVTNLNNKIKEKYPTLTRGIMKKQGYGVNGIYNQDINKNVILIEIGGNKNNIEEVNNTLDLIAEIIGEYIYEKK